jgi:predicted benzoate:H+ symporter BenE
MNYILRPITASLLAGILLGLFLKFVESVTGLKVYTLLLNVDYIPILKDIKVSEIIEFLLHLIVSVVLGVLLHIYLINNDFPIKLKVKFVVKVSLLIGLFLYPTTMLSDRTPEITSAYSFFFWMVGHGLYGVVLGKLISGNGRRS